MQIEAGVRASQYQRSLQGIDTRVQHSFLGSRATAFTNEAWGASAVPSAAPFPEGASWIARAAWLEVRKMTVRSRRNIIGSEG
jgi:hypothetical protein